MAQSWVRASYMRGGTSKGLFFREEDLPEPGPERDDLFLAVTGSPDPYGRQLDGMGGGVSSLSKVVSVRASGRTDVDLEYTFGQVAVDRPLVDYSGNCGNLSSAVGPFAVDEGLLGPVPDGEVTLRILNTNTGKILRAAFAVEAGAAEVSGDLRIPGVAGSGAPVRLDYLDPGGARTGALLPAGSARTRLRVDGWEFHVSCVDATNPVVFVDASSLGLTGVECPARIDDDADLLALLERLRRAGAAAMGLAGDDGVVPEANPKIAIVGRARDYHDLSGRLVEGADHDLSVRMLSMGRVHRAVTGTGALCAAVAARVPGSVLDEVGEPGPAGGLRIGSPSGVLTVEADVVVTPAGPYARSASLHRTARRLMRGAVAVPQYRSKVQPV
ncbi:PrpF domain-containing protein [Pseudonocardia alni]|uniref:PrpF domain-containing protein n=1 Tax=Pseudonocardia alni TaxID=33907 RepID=UPI00280AFF0B|nr:PrpF domain-containing protein [Pseudonocardia alni]